MAMLDVSEIHTFYGNIEALKGISLTVEEGECVTLIGSNGAGKSTTLRSVLGLVHPDAGTATVLGVAYGELGDYDRAIQDYNQALTLRPGDRTSGSCAVVCVVPAINAPRTAAYASRRTRSALPWRRSTRTAWARTTRTSPRHSTI